MELSMLQSSEAGRLDRHAPHSARPRDCERSFSSAKSFRAKKSVATASTQPAGRSCERLGLAGTCPAIAAWNLDAVEFIAIGGRKNSVDLPTGDDSEIAIKRSFFDNLLFNRARELGAEIQRSHGSTAIAKNASHRLEDRHRWETILASRFWLEPTAAIPPWRVFAICFRASSVNVSRFKRTFRCRRNFGNRVVLQFLPEGYSGQAPVNERELNLCLVGRPPTIASLRTWAERKFEIPADQPWRTITPLTRAPVSAAHENLFFIGDAARVVEPLTGEGIYYALRSGELAANAIVKIIRGRRSTSQLCVNLRALTRPCIADDCGSTNWHAQRFYHPHRIAFRERARFDSSILRLLTAKIVRPAL